MLNKLAAALALVLTSLVLVPVLGAPATAADDYTAGVRTSCHVAVPAVVGVRTAPRVRVHVRPNAPNQAAGTRADRPTGSVTVSIRKGGTSIFTRTVDYDGTPVTIQGPRITSPGHYTVRGTFRTDDGTVFKSCQGGTSFDVRAGHSPDDDDPDPGPNPGNHNPDGLLPDTGGPHVLWLLLALALVGAGGGMVHAARRRPKPSPYEV